MNKGYENENILSIFLYLEQKQRPKYIQIIYSF